MTSPPTAHRLSSLLTYFLLFLRLAAGLTTDGILLLSFKYAVLTDTVGALTGWNYDDATPCSWRGVTCASADGVVHVEPTRVVSLSLPGCRILGSLSPDLGLIQHLRLLDLSGNYLNGSLPLQLFNASELAVLNLADNELSGDLPDLFSTLPALQTVNISANAFVGAVPASLAAVPNLTVLSISNNYISGVLPAGFAQARVLDFSSNLINGSLSSKFTGAGGALRYLNLSANRLSGEIPPQLGSRIPANATVDLSYNNFTGPIPDGGLMYQKATAFSGNVGLCGKPLRNPCSIVSTLAFPPNVTGSPPALAAIPKNFPFSPAGRSESNATNSSDQRQGLKPGVIAGIVVGDMAGIGILAAVFLYVYNLKKKKSYEKENAVISALKAAEMGGGIGKSPVSKAVEWSPPDSGRGAWSCIGKISGGGATGNGTAAAAEASSTDSSGSESEPENNAAKRGTGGSLVSVDGETELELETLLKASAYILGATGASIVYKAVLADGTALAVRRIGESGIGRFREFESRVRAYAKLRHPNLVRIRGFYWGDDEKLVIYDYATNGSLANLTHKKLGSSSPGSLSWETRLGIAKGMARGLGYLHEKKYVHGNVKPSNILLGPDMEAMLGDYGLERVLIAGESSSKAGAGGGSSRHFGSKRSTLSQGSVPDASTVSPVQCSHAAALPYVAPESLKNLKPSTKWDVYSFGIVLLELLTGRAFNDREMVQWNNSVLAGEDRDLVLRSVDCGLRGEASEAREEAILACFRLGLSCAALSPQRRPSMKEAVQIVDKVPSFFFHQQN